MNRRELISGAAASALFAGLTEAEAMSPGQRLVLLGGAAASFPRAGASIDIDLVGNRAFVAGTGIVAVSSLLSISRADAVNYTDAAGLLSSVAANTLAMGTSGLQIFGSRQQNLVDPNNPSTANWGATSNCTVAATVATTGPTGALDAYRISATAGGTFFRGQTSKLTVAAGDYTTASAYVKYDGTYRYAGIRGDKPTTARAIFDFQTGIATMLTFSGASNQGNVGMVALGNGWYRVWITWNATTSGTIQALFQTDQGTFGTPTAGQGYYISRCMVAPGQISPYVDNATAGALTVAADDISATGALATALATSTGTLRIDTLSTTRRSNSNAIGSAVAKTLMGANGVVLMGSDTSNKLSTAVGATLASPDYGVWNDNPNAAVLAWDGSGGFINVNGYTATDANARTPAGTFKLGSTDGSAGFWNGNLSRLTFYATKNQIVLNSAAKKFVMVGDSIPAGFNSNQPFPELIARDLNTVVSNQSVAGAGWTTDPGGGSLTARAAAAVDPLVAFNGSAATTKLGLFAGTNDIFTSALTGAQTFAAFETYIQARNAAGWLYSNMVVFTMLPRGGAHETERADYNAALVAGAVTYGYQLVRLDLDTYIGAPGADGNRAYYGFDKIHPTDWSQDRIKSLAEALFAS